MSKTKRARTPLPDSPRAMMDEREAARNAMIRWAKSARAEVLKHVPAAVEALKRLAAGVRVCGTNLNALNPIKSARDEAWNEFVGVYLPLVSRETEPGEMVLRMPDGTPHLERASHSSRMLNADEQGVLRSVCGPLVDAVTACNNLIDETPSGDRQGAIVPDLAERIERAAGLLAEAAGIACGPMLPRGASDADFRPASAFPKGLASALRMAAAPGRKTMRVRSKKIDGVKCYSWTDAMHWWPNRISDPQAPSARQSAQRARQ